MKLSYLAICSLALAPTLAFAALGDNVNARQPFTGVYLQGGIGFNKSTMTNTVNTSYPDLDPGQSANITQGVSKSGVGGQIAAGYRFALNKNLRMGVDILGSVSQSQTNQNFTFNLAFPPDSQYQVNVKLSHDYALSALVEFGYATSRNMFSVFAGPTVTQLGRVASGTLINPDGSTLDLGSTKRHFTTTGFSFGGGFEHMFTNNIGVYLRGMYTGIPTVKESTQVTVVNSVNSKDAHTYSGQLGFEISFA
jgi:hypothetical protein